MGVIYVYFESISHLSGVHEDVWGIIFKWYKGGNVGYNSAPI